MVLTTIFISFISLLIILFSFGGAFGCWSFCNAIFFFLLLLFFFFICCWFFAYFLDHFPYYELKQFMCNFAAVVAAIVDLYCVKHFLLALESNIKNWKNDSSQIDTFLLRSWKLWWKSCTKLINKSLKYFIPNRHSPLRSW